MLKYCVLLAVLLSIVSINNYAQSPLPIIIDTDPALGVINNGAPGDIDDGLAIIESINHPNLDVIGITVVFGNSKLAQGMQVALDLVNLKQTDIPVIAGASGPADQNTEAVDYLASHLKSRKLTIVALGPLTNIAALIQNHPDLVKNIDRIIAVMGRSPGQDFYIGDYGPVRDFNYIKDPESANYVMNSGIPIVLAPFELSVQAVITKNHLKKIKSHDTEAARYLFDKAQAWVNHWIKAFPNENGFHPWDSAAIAFLTTPELLSCKNRGFRSRMVSDPAHGIGNSNTGLIHVQQPWLELDENFEGKQILYCDGFQSGKKEEFVKRIVNYVY